MEKDLNYWKKNAEEDYMKVPISVLRYITELEKVVLPQSIGVLFIRWNLYNRVAVAVAYFEDGKMVYMAISKNKMLKLCSNFLPKDVTYGFISEYPIAMKKQKTNESFWNEMAIQQNGILELNKVSPITIKLNRKEFNKFAKLYLK